MNLGALKAGKLFMQIEKNAKEHIAADYATLMEQAVAELDKVKKFLEKQ